MNGQWTILEHERVKNAPGIVFSDHLEIKNMIETKEFDIPSKFLFGLMFRQLMVIFGWISMYSSVVLFALGIIDGDLQYYMLLVVAMAGFFLTFAGFYARTLAFAKENHPITQRRTMKFGDGKYFIDCEDGTQVQAPLTRFHRAKMLCGCYLLYVNQKGYFLVPKTAFRTEEDRKRFETEILGDKLQVASLPWKKVGGLLLFSAIVIGYALLHQAEEPTFVETDIHHVSPPSDD